MGSLETDDNKVVTISVPREGAPLRRTSRITSAQDHQFFERFRSALLDCRLNPDELVFSGFDGSGVKHGRGSIPVMDRQYIWVMDAVSWRKGLTYTTPGTAADYADRYAVPCIGVYATDELREVELTHAPDPTNSSDDGFVPRDPLSIGFPEGGIYDTVTHIDHPNSLVTAALRAMVFLEYPSASIG